MSLKIPRSVVNQILAKAMSLAVDEPLWGCFDLQSQHCAFYAQRPDRDVSQMQDYVLIYNQSSSIVESIEKLQSLMLNQQTIIEIFEDTKGVVGLRAYIKRDKMMMPIELEFSH